MRPPSPRLLFTLVVVAALLMLGVLPRVFDWLQEQERASRPPRAGLFLVARPGRVDRNFDKTVVLLIEVGPDRTWGLVLNRLRTPQDTPLPADVMRWGGPVTPERRTTLIRARENPEGARRILEGLSWREGVALEGDTLTFAGVAGWRPGQLEQELARGGWVLMDASAEQVFSEPGVLWAECIARHF
ncbi:YqgE/AlgH family protein [Hyalangium rubrum]|uniref:YqgE/AlgH family protein n=1 Tax=Hyalangium rubrum TaxID=3103134 RepID=A0ABU5GW25_9BACT|nr:YqgE/AlgH family protein [Hyalangium sp. s54d21]MDY7224909.1 YqgE/AlgH family protein [Hyalangium sp. s54d21]